MAKPCLVSPTPSEQGTLGSSCWEDTSQGVLCRDSWPSREGSLLLDGLYTSMASHLYTWQQHCPKGFPM